MRLNTTVSSLNLAGQAVVLSDGAVLPYDHLVLSPGVVGDASGIQGMGDALDMYNHADVGRQEAGTPSSSFGFCCLDVSDSSPRTSCKALKSSVYKESSIVFVCFISGIYRRELPRRGHC